KHFLNDPMPVEDDHAPFLKAGVAAALLIDFDYPPWHTKDDTLDKVSARSLAIVGDVVLDAIPSIEHYLTIHPAGTRRCRRDNRAWPRGREFPDPGDDPILNEMFAKDVDAFGAVSNTTKVQAHTPAILKAAKMLSAAVERSGLLPKELLPLVYL